VVSIGAFGTTTLLSNNLNYIRFKTVCIYWFWSSSNSVRLQLHPILNLSSILQFRLLRNGFLFLVSGVRLRTRIVRRIRSTCTGIRFGNVFTIFHHRRTNIIFEVNIITELGRRRELDKCAFAIWLKIVYVRDCDLFIKLNGSILSNKKTNTSSCAIIFSP
jgi:hypothetical protein